MNEVTKTKTQVPTEFNDNAFGEASEHDVSANEIVIPKLIVGQPGSPQVLSGDWSFGDLRSTLDDELMADAGKGGKEGKALTFTPIHHNKFWITKKKAEGKFKFESMEPITFSNEKLNAYEIWKGADGVERKREFLHLFYILVPGRPLPYTLGFRGAAKRNGDKLLTQMYILNKMLNVKEAWKRSPFATTMKAFVRKESRNDTTFALLDVAKLRDTTFEEACECLKWHNQIKEGQTKLDNRDIEGTSKNFADPDSLKF